MPPPPTAPPRHRAFSGGLLISLVFHAVVIGLLVWFAARGGMLGQPLRQITVRLMPPPEPEKAPAPEPPKPEPPKEKSMPVAEPAPAKFSASLPAKTAAPLPAAAPVVASPAPAEMPSLAFDDGGKTVQTENDPAALYRSFVEFSLRSRWNRPTDLADQRYVAEVEIGVDAAGNISDPRWKRKTGNTRWDRSVMDAIAQAGKLPRPPPPGFPIRLTVRFDVVQAAELNLP